MLTLAQNDQVMGYVADAGRAVRPENGETAVATIAEIAQYRPADGPGGYSHETLPCKGAHCTEAESCS